MPIVAFIVIRFISGNVYILFALVCTAPFFWGPVGWFAGVFQDRLREVNRGLEDRVAERTGSIQSLLDVSGQGFLSFGTNFVINPEHSRECERIFGGAIAGSRIDQLLYANPTQAAEFVKGLRLYFEGRASAEVIFDLLDHELSLRDKLVRTEYRAVTTDRIMVILTDVTDERELQERVQGENERRDLLLRVMSHKEYFGSFTREAARVFAELKGEVENVEKLVRDVHTFKGTAGFFGFHRSQGAAHDLEGYLSDAASLGESPVVDGRLTDLRHAFGEEITVVTGTLGSDWITEAEAVLIPKNEYLKIERHVDHHHPADTLLRRTLEHYRKRALASLFARFPQMARDLALQRGRRIEPVEVSGGKSRVIPEQWERLVSAFVHIVRNMVDHGIEPPPEREALGKPPAGKISIDIRDAAEAVTFVFEDDGRGIAFEELERRGRALGMIGPVEKPTTRQLMELIFRDGFTTAAMATVISGRGVGLPAVREAVHAMGGTIRVSTRRGSGTKFIITIPRKGSRKEIA